MKSQDDSSHKLRYTAISDINNAHLKGGIVSFEELFDDEQKKLLLKNGKDRPFKNNVPIAYLRIVKLGYRFLLTELNPDNPYLAYGLSDYDTDLKIGEINLNTLIKTAAENKEELISKWDFDGKYNLAVYIKVAQEIGTVVTDPSKEGYRKEFKVVAKDENIDPEQDLRYLKNRLT